MGWQNQTHVLAIKDRVRRRDGQRCAVCRMDRGTHEKRYGKDLDVHRVVPGSDYSCKRGECLTLCPICHLALHGKGSWEWVATKVPYDTDALDRWIQTSKNYDYEEELAWRKQEAWGKLLKGLRKSKGWEVDRLAGDAEIERKAVECFEAGRQQPLLFEAQKLAKALNISLDELPKEQKSADNGWVKSNQEQSELRAEVFRAVLLRAREFREEGKLIHRPKLVGEIVEERRKGAVAQEESRMVDGGSTQSIWD